VHIAAGITFLGSPILSLELRRRVGWGGTDTILQFALRGNVPGIQSLLINGKASLTDVDPNHGRTALHVSLIRLPFQYSD
jgi:hypothetical protein